MNEDPDESQSNYVEEDDMRVVKRNSDRRNSYKGNDLI